MSDWTDLFGYAATTVISIAVPIVVPYAINFMKSKIHSADVEIYMEAGMNAAGRVMLNAAKRMQDGGLKRDTIADFLNEEIKREAGHVITNLVPEVSAKLGKVESDVQDLIAAKVGNQIEKLLPPADATTANLLEVKKVYQPDVKP